MLDAPDILGVGGIQRRHTRTHNDLCAHNQLERTEQQGVHKESLSKPPEIRTLQAEPELVPCSVLGPRILPPHRFFGGRHDGTHRYTSRRRRGRLVHTLGTAQDANWHIPGLSSLIDTPTVLQAKPGLVPTREESGRARVVCFSCIFSLRKISLLFFSVLWFLGRPEPSPF